MVGLRSRCVAQLSKVGGSKGLHYFGQCVSFANAPAAQPNSSVVVSDRSHWEEVRACVWPGIETLLQAECHQCYGVDLLLGALGIGGKLPCRRCWPL